MTIVEKIKYLLKENKIKNAKVLAEISNITQNSVVRLKNYKLENIKVGTVKNLSEFFKVSTDYLIFDDITDPNHGTNKSNHAIMDLVLGSDKTLEEIAKELGVSEEYLTDEFSKIIERIKTVCPESDKRFAELKEEMESLYFSKIKALSGESRLKLEGVIDVYGAEDSLRNKK